jgi:hypothetical protein
VAGSYVQNEGHYFCLVLVLAGGIVILILLLLCILRDKLLRACLPNWSRKQKLIDDIEAGAG